MLTLENDFLRLHMQEKNKKKLLYSVAEWIDPTNYGYGDRYVFDYESQELDSPMEQR